VLRPALMEKDVRAVVEVLVHECSWGGVAHYRNCPKAVHVLAQLCDWVHWVHYRGQ
jgi:hypothetical protein